MPNDQQIVALHRKYAKTTADFDLIYQHCLVVEAIAMQLLATRPIAHIDRQLIHVGALLHDIGSYQVIENGTWVQGVRHGVIGEEILKTEGCPPSVCRIASHHTGVGLTAQDVIDQNLPIPAADYTANSDEERLIMYADSFHTKDIPQPKFHSYNSYRKFISQYGDNKVAAFDALAEHFGKPDINSLSARFATPIMQP